jgi:hypothetical protein
MKKIIIILVLCFTFIFAYTQKYFVAYLNSNHAVKLGFESKKEVEDYINIIIKAKETQFIILNNYKLLIQYYNKNYYLFWLPNDFNFNSFTELLELENVNKYLIVKTTKKKIIIKCLKILI